MEELGLMDVDRVAGGMFSDTGFSPIFQASYLGGQDQLSTLQRAKVIIDNRTAMTMLYETWICQ